jgi:uroporphyrinogen-III synthase
MSGTRLAGLGVVITRPRVAAEPLAEALEREGARTWIFPALAIEDISLSEETLEALDGLAGNSLAVFVSANAAQKGLELALERGPWPEGVEVAAVGDATASVLRNSGLRSVISPGGRQDSDGLLELSRLHRVKGENIIVFRGEGGRERLREVLEERGARVRYAECYRRVRPKLDAAPLLEAWSRDEIHAVGVLSAETLVNFVEMMGEAGRAFLARTALVVPHEAIARHPEAKRFARVEVSRPGPEGAIESLQRIREALGRAA